MTTRTSSSSADTDLGVRIQRLEEQLHCEERRRRRIERIAVCGGIVLLGLGALAATGLDPIADVVQTRRLEILDANDRVVVLAAGAQHGGRIDLWDATEKNAARLGCNAVGGDLSLFNRDGRQVLAAYADGTAGRVEVNGPRGIPNVLLAADESGGLVTTADDDGLPVTKLAAGDGHGRLEINGPAGVVCRIESDAGAGRLDLRSPLDEAGTVLEAAGRLEMASGRNPVVRLGYDEERAILELNDENGGAARIQIHGSSDGGLVKAMNAENVEAVVLGTSPRGSGLRVYNGDDVGVIAIGADADGRGAVEVASETGIRSCTLNATATGGGLSLADPVGKALVELEVLAAGGRLNLMDQRDDLVVSLRAIEGGADFKMGLNDADVGISMEASRDRAASMGLFGPGGRTVTLSANPTGGRIRLFDADGRPTITTGPATTGSGGAISLRNGTGIQAVRMGITVDGEGQLELFNPTGTRKRTLTSP